jgi:hypothetical protein
VINYPHICEKFMELIKLNGLIQCVPDNIEIVVSLIRAGMTLKNVSEVEGMPPYPQLCQWMRNSPDFKREYQAAIEYRSHSFHSKAVDAFDRIADGTAPMTKEELDREKAVVDIGLKLAKLDNPAQYGDKIQVNSNHKAIVIITGIPENLGGDLGEKIFGRNGELDTSAKVTDPITGTHERGDSIAEGGPESTGAEGTHGDW